MRKKRGVMMVTVSATTLKRAFRKAFPEQTAQELHPRWSRFWATVVLSAQIEMVATEATEEGLQEPGVKGNPEQEDAVNSVTDPQPGPEPDHEIETEPETV